MSENEPAGELFHERTLTERISQVRLVLTLANFAVIWLDQTVPSARTAQAYAEAVAAASIFFLYAGTAWLLLKRRRISLKQYLLLSPVLDIVFVSLLIITTDGYLSPFNLWFVFVVVGSGFSRYRLLPVATAVMGLTAHSIIAAIPQELPLDLSVFTVRTVYLFGLAAVLSAITSYLVGQSKALATVEAFSRKLGTAMTQDELSRLVTVEAARLLDVDAKAVYVNVSEAGSDQIVPKAESPGTTTWRLQAAGRTLGTLSVHRRAPLPRAEYSFVQILCDRAAAALLRIRMLAQLVDAAAAAERTRLADQLHDTYLQSLAALDLRAEVARSLAEEEGRKGRVVEELRALKEAARRAAAQMRDLLDMPGRCQEFGPAVLRRTVAERWQGPCEVSIDPDLRLSERRWRALEMLVMEGLNNIAKHTSATRVALQVGRTETGRIFCSLEDDGPGFQPPARFGYGLTRLRHVVEQEQGQLRIAPGSSGGVILMAEFEPLP